MNCIDEQLLQKYIDDECTEIEKAVVKQHLSGCTACAQKQVERKKLSNELKQTINSLSIETIEIPAFKNSNTKTTSTVTGKNLKLIIYSLSAACILLFVLFVVDKKIEPNQKEITIVQSIPREVDANRPAGEQEFVIEVYDGKGNYTEYLIE